MFDILVSIGHWISKAILRLEVSLSSLSKHTEGAGDRVVMDRPLDEEGQGVWRKILPGLHSSGWGINLKACGGMAAC